MSQLRFLSYLFNLRFLFVILILQSVEPVIRHIGRFNVDRRIQSAYGARWKGTGGVVVVLTGNWKTGRVVLQVYGEITRVMSCCSCGSMGHCLILYSIYISLRYAINASTWTRFVKISGFTRVSIINPSRTFSPEVVR